MSSYLYNFIRNFQIMFQRTILQNAKGSLDNVSLLESVWDSCLIEQDCYNLAVFHQSGEASQK